MILVDGGNTVFARLTPWFAHLHAITNVNITSYNVISSSSFKNPDEEKGQHWKSWSFGQKSWLQLAPTNLSCISHFRALPCDIKFRLGIGQMLPLHAVLVFKSNKRGEVLEPTTKILEIVWSCRFFMEILWKGEKSEVEGNVNICHSLSTIWVCHPPTHIELPTVYTLHGESQMFAFAHCVSLNSVYIIATRYYKDILPLPLLLVSSSVYIVSTKWWRSYLGSP